MYIKYGITFIDYKTFSQLNWLSKAVSHYLMFFVELFFIVSKLTQFTGCKV